jgi:hypothetical protein
MDPRHFALVVAGIVSVAAALSAQQSAADAAKTPTKPQAATVTITGCVAQGVDADHYVLANAVRREDPPASAAKAGTSRTTRSDKRSASDRTGPYDLQGGEFKAHLGHEVEVTGTSVVTGNAAAATTGASGTEKLPLPRFNVLSVKMIAASCT